MKISSTLLCTLLVVVIRAQVLMVDSFNYPGATILGGNGDWTQSSPLTTGATVYNSAGLVYPSYSNANSGCAEIFTNGNPGDLVYKNIGPSVNSGDLYISFLINVTTAPTSTSNPYCIALGDQSSFSYGIRLLVRQGSTPNFVNFGTRKATGTDAWSTGDYPLGNTHLLVLKYVFNNGSTADDVAQIFVNPTSLSTEPTVASADASAGGDFASSFVHFIIRNNGGASGPSAKIDEIHIARTWTQLFDGSIPASVADVEANKIAIYPNPARTEIYFGTALISAYRIFNSQGQLVQSGKGQKAEIADLPQGFYTVLFTTLNGNRESTTILIKQ
jgi:hypothetical protein